ncbi:MAG: molybdopterin molybdenumtransferase MoeA [Chloroflexi bacterium]|nr:molybdopterin molybdenumtransferase MoeA [Chloroflexota bacterium]
MSEMFNVLTPDEAFQVLKQHLSPLREREVVPSAEALGRITAEEVRSPEDLPAFPRSTMDGYSVRSQDTYGATEAVPAYLEVVGEVATGEASTVELGRGQAAKAYTGGMLAGSADAVVMVERTQQVDETTIEVVRAVAPGENVVNVGEDVRRGDAVLPPGHLIRPQDIGGLMALGLTDIAVTRRPRVAIVSTGDELVPPAGNPGPAQIRDVNTYTVSSLVSQAGGIPMPVGLVADEYEAQREAAIRGLDTADVLVFSAGSSLSSRDLTAAVIDALGAPGVLVHGISIKPGKPTIVGVVDGKPAFGLPGNPVSAMVVFGLLVRPTIALLSGLTGVVERPTVVATLTRDIPSLAGREDHVEVHLVHEDGRIDAEPVFGKSNLIFTLMRADGTVKVPLDKGGLYAGEQVEVSLY